MLEPFELSGLPPPPLLDGPFPELFDEPDDLGVGGKGLRF